MTHIFFLHVYLNSLHVSGSHMTIIKRIILSMQFFFVCMIVKFLVLFLSLMGVFTFRIDTIILLMMVT